MAKSGSGDPSFTSTSRAGAPRYPGGRRGVGPRQGGERGLRGPPAGPRILGSGTPDPGEPRGPGVRG